MKAVCDFILVKALRSAGHDVLSVTEITPRAEDSDIIELALKEKGILLTEDKDFGQLVYAHGRETLGVIFLRFPHSARERISEDVCTFAKEWREKLVRSFVTVQPGRIRMSHIPEN